MEKINKYLLAEIICNIGNFRDVVRLCRVCKRWEMVIREYSHNFTLQGAWHCMTTPSNGFFNSIFKGFPGRWKLNTLDLRNVRCGELLEKVLLNQPHLKKLDLTNCQINFYRVLSNMIKKKKGWVYSLEEFRITNYSQLCRFNDLLADMYPNISRFYLANTGLPLKELRIILTKQAKLQILDISLCDLTSSEIESLDFSDLLKVSPLETLFITNISKISIGILSRLNVKVVTKTVGEVIFKVTSVDHLYILKDFLSEFPDVNTKYQVSNKLGKIYTSYPQSHLIKQTQNDILLCEIFKLLIKSGLNLANHPNQGYSLINAAIAASHHNLLRLLLSNGHDFFHNVFSKENLPIIHAIQLNDLAALKIFVNFNIQNTEFLHYNGCTPICQAAFEGNIEIFLYLFEKTTRILPCGFHKNLLKRSHKIFQIIFDPECKKRLCLTTETLHEAAQWYISARKSDFALVIIENFENDAAEVEKKVLEETWKDPEKQYSNLWSPIIVNAVKKGFFDVVESLLKKGLYIDEECEDGTTAFMAACDDEDIEMMLYLNGKNAKVDKRDKYKRTALAIASRTIWSMEAIRVLLKLGLI